MVEVQCPTCFEYFYVHAPSLEECPCDLDYDCEICCRPMILHFEADDDEVIGYASGLNEA